MIPGIRGVGYGAIPLGAINIKLDITALYN